MTKSRDKLRGMFDKLRGEYEEEDKSRDDLINKSREVIKLSKRIIYSVHRNELSKAGEYVKEIKKKKNEIYHFNKQESYLKNAIQEYVEALLFYNYVKNNEIVSPNKLKVRYEAYLLGLCDLTGELMRYATNQFINGNFNKVFDVKKILDLIYDELSLFDFRNSELRRKYDSIKYSVKKIDDLIIEIKKQKVSLSRHKVNLKDY